MKDILEERELGGLLICFAQNFDGNGIFSSNGSKGGNGTDNSSTYHICPGGGGSGAGSVNLFYTKNYNADLKLEAKGGAGGSGVGTSSSAPSATRTRWWRWLHRSNFNKFLAQYK